MSFWRKVLEIPGHLFWKAVAVIIISLFLCLSYYVEKTDNEAAKVEIQQYANYLKGSNYHLQQNKQQKTVHRPAKAAAPVIIPAPQKRTVVNKVYFQ